jgi:ATP-dependent Clp protease adaptor protein ClpS
MIHFGTKTQQEEEVALLTEEEKKLQLIIYNDDVNTFDFVIETLVEVLGHDPIQAEQCTWLIHYKGKCAVKEGSFEKLEPLCNKILNLGLSAAIE